MSEHDQASPLALPPDVPAVSTPSILLKTPLLLSVLIGNSVLIGPISYPKKVTRALLVSLASDLSDEMMVGEALHPKMCPISYLLNRLVGNDVLVSTGIAATTFFVKHREVHKAYHTYAASYIRYHVDEYGDGVKVTAAQFRSICETESDANDITTVEAAWKL